MILSYFIFFSPHLVANKGYCIVIIITGPRWEDQQAMYIGLRYPEDARKKRKRRKHSRTAKTGDTGTSSDSAAKQCQSHAVIVIFTYLLRFAYRSGDRTEY